MMNFEKASSQTMFAQVSENEFIEQRNMLELDLFAFLTPHAEN